MKSMTRQNKLGLSVFALTALSTVCSQTFANDYSVITSLPVITDDCGGAGCEDRRSYSIEQFQAALTAASNAAKQGSSAKNSKATDTQKGQGLAIGQGNNDTQVVFLNFEQS